MSPIVRYGSDLAASLAMLMMAHYRVMAQFQPGLSDRLLEIGAGGLFSYIIIKLVLDYLRSRDRVARDRRVDDDQSPVVFSRELVTVLADIKNTLREIKVDASSQHQTQIGLMQEMVTRMRIEREGRERERD